MTLIPGHVLNMYGACYHHPLLMQLTFEKMGDKLIPPDYKLSRCNESRVRLDFNNIVSAMHIPSLYS